MPVKQPKKLLIMNILDILRKYSDEEHRLSQKDIAEILKTEYDMTADRKAIRRNILNLMDCGYSNGAEPQDRRAGGELPVVRLLSGAGLHRR